MWLLPFSGMAYYVCTGSLSTRIAARKQKTVDSTADGCSMLDRGTAHGICVREPMPSVLMAHCRVPTVTCLPGNVVRKRKKCLDIKNHTDFNTKF